jgi:hypothetical protein
MPACCLNPENYVYSPSATRTGWFECNCRECGTFIGFTDLPHGEAQPKATHAKKRK